MRFVLLFYLILGFNIAQAQEKSFPYQLNKGDCFLLPLGLVTEASAYFLEKKKNPMTSAELLALDKMSINGFDRGAINKWNTTADNFSEFTKWGLFISPGAVLLPRIKNKEWKNTMTYGVMYFEVAMLTIGLTDITKVISQRERPYLYNSNLTLQQKQEYINAGDDRDSFFSGHTSIAFASAVYLSKTVSDIYGKGTLSKIVWTSSLAVASTTAYLRYESGHHYPSDILMGAIVGSAVGYCVPVLHKKGGRLSQTSFVMLPNYLTLVYRF